jgi:hypothetical protein
MVFVADDLLFAAFATGFLACTALSGLRAVAGFDEDFAGDFLICAIATSHSATIHQPTGRHHDIHLRLRLRKARNQPSTGLALPRQQLSHLKTGPLRLQPHPFIVEEEFVVGTVGPRVQRGTNGLTIDGS